MITTQLVIDCADPAGLVRFWCAALDYRPVPPPDGFDTWNAFYLSIGVPAEELPADGDAIDRIHDPDGLGSPIWFQVVPEAKTVKNRLHLDLLVGGGRGVPPASRRERVDAKVAGLLAAGASIVRTMDDEHHYGVTLRDPEGNEFCVA